MKTLILNFAKTIRTELNELGKNAGSALRH